MNITFFTKQGGVREHNEDAMFLAGSIISGCSMIAPVTVNTESADKCFVVVDGMGGYHGDEMAANIVASSFTSDAEGWNIPVESVKKKLRAYSKLPRVRFLRLSVSNLVIVFVVIVQRIVFNRFPALIEDLSP